MPERPEPLAPPLAVASLLAGLAAAAALADCAIFAALLKRRLRTGLFSIIIQLSIVDALLLGTTAGPELWSLNLRSWQFGSTGCAAYQGLNVFTYTLSTYLVIAITLHTLTTIQLEEKTAERRMKRNHRDDEDDEIRSSQHSLVANSDSATPPRTMNVDYRVTDTRVPVTLPTFLIWVLAASLSVPEYALAAIVHSENSTSICTLDSKHQFNVYSLLAVFNLFFPLFLISVIGVFVIIKLKTRKNVVTGILECSESRAALKLSLCLMCLQILFCFPRSFFSAYRVYSSSDSGNGSGNYLEKNDMLEINLVLSVSYLTAALIRPLLCMLMLPQLSFFFKFNSIISKV